jgi:hypothetical protein
MPELPFASSLFNRNNTQPKPITVIAGVPNSFKSAIIAVSVSIIDLLIKICLCKSIVVKTSGVKWVNDAAPTYHPPLPPPHKKSAA